MQAKKTHEQQLKIIEKREDTRNAGSDFDMKGDLARGEAAKTALAEGAALRTGMKDLASDRGMIPERNRESQYNKPAGH